MKKSIIVLALMVATASIAQGIDSRAPEGATGPGVQFTKRVRGTIIGVGSPIYRNVVVAVDCPKPKERERHSVVNPGTAVGAVVGGVAGRAIGKNTTSTVIGAVAGAAVGNEIDRRADERRYSAPDANGCVSIFEQQIVGWNYTAAQLCPRNQAQPMDEVCGIQAHGIKTRQPNIGDDTTLIVVSTVYAGE